MADSCAEVSAALASLEGKIGSIPRVNEQSIIDKASTNAQSLLDPKIAAVGIMAGGAASNASSAATAAALAKGIADGAVRALAPIAARVTALAGQVLGLVTRFAGVLLLLVNVAATIASYVVLQRQIDAMQREIAFLRDLANGAFKQANAAMDQANKAIGRANLATRIGVDASKKADFAIDETKVLATALNKTTVQANEAILKAEQALYRTDILATAANTAIGKSNLAIENSNRAIGDANHASFLAENAGLRADNAVYKADLAINKADSAIGAANTANRKADGATARANQAIAEVNNLGTSLRGEFNIKIGYANGLINNLNNKVDGLFGNTTTNTATANTAKSIAIQANANSLKIYEPQIFNQQLRASNVVQPIALSAAKAEIQRTIDQEFAFDPRAVRPLTIEQASAEFKRKVDSDFPFDPAAVRPVAIAAARQEVQGRFDEIKAANQAQLGQLGGQIREFAKGLQQQATNLVIPAASASPAVMERAIAQSPTVSGLKGELAQVKANQFVTEAVNTKANEKLDRIDAKLTPIIANTANNGPAIKGVEDLVRSIVPKINEFVKDVNNLVGQIGVVLGKINALIGQLNNFIQSVNQQLRAILNYLIAALAILTFVQAQVVVVVTQVAIMGTRLLNLVKYLALDRVLGLLNFLANLHNASMLTSNLKVTLLEMLASVGNATGLLETADGDNVELNQVFNQGIEQFCVGLIGVDAWASMKLTWRKYSPIYRAASNSLSSIGNMFSSIGNGIEVIGERTGRIGNSLRAAGVVRENAFNYMSENMNVHTNRFMTFGNRIGGVTQFVEAINEVAENVIEGQQAHDEAVKAKDAFRLELAKVNKADTAGVDADNEAIKVEAEKIKANLVKDPTGEKETGYFNFLTDN